MNDTRHTDTWKMIRKGKALQLFMTATAIVAMAANSAFATTYNMTSSYSDKDTAWGSAAAWDDGSGNHPSAAPSSADATGTEFCVNDGLIIRTTAAKALYGTICIGDDTTEGTVYNKITGDKFTTYVDGLVIKSGAYEPVNSNASAKRACIGGRIVVASAEGSPFAFERKGNSNGLGFLIAADIEGDAGTGFEFKGSGRYNSVMTLTGDNSAYLGQIKVSGTYTSGYTDTTLIVDGSATALGGAPVSAKQDAVLFSFQNSARLVLTNLAENAVVGSANRGIQASFTGSTERDAFYLDVASDITLASPLAGDAPIKKTGAGILTLAGSYSSETLSVVEGAGGVVLASEEAIAGVGRVNADLSIRSPSAAAFTARGVTFDGGRVEIIMNAGNVGTCQMDGDCTISSSPIALALETSDDIYGISEAKMMTVPSSVKTVTEDDFTFDATLLPLGLPRFAIEIRDEGGDVQGVYIVRRYPVVFRADANTDATFSTGGTTWSDGNKVMAGRDYAITNGATIRATSNFDGESLTLGDGATLTLKQNSQTIGDLFAYPGSTINNGKANNAAALTLRGNLHVYGTWDSPVFVKDHASSAGTVLAGALLGDGVLRFARNTGSAFHASITGDNSDFAGSIAVDTGNASWTMELTVGSAASLGGDIASFNYRALKLGAGATLVPAETMTLAALNRGILVAGDAKIDVPDGVTLTVEEPITYSGSLVKVGTGTLVISGAAYFENAGGDGVTMEPTSGKNALVLSNGVVQANSAASLSNVVVKAGAGTLALGMPLGERGLERVAFDVSDSGLNVSVPESAHGGGFCLFTVSAEDAPALVGKVSCLAKSEARQTLLDVTTRENGDGTVSFRASKLGLIIFVR